MRKLLLLRHGHAPSIEGVGDKERKLSKLGKDECKDISIFLSSFDPTPELILSSSSLRTRETTKLVAEKIKKKTKIAFTDRLYNVSIEEILNLIKETNDKIETLMIVGHNPSITSLGEFLNPSNKKSFPNFSNYHITCKLVILNIADNSWANLKSSSIEVLDVIVPRI